MTEEKEDEREESHCMRDPSVIGACAGPGACSCECNTCHCPLCGVNPCECERSMGFTPLEGDP